MTTTNKPNGAVDPLSVMKDAADALALVDKSGMIVSNIPEMVRGIRKARTAVAALIARNSELEAERDALRDLVNSPELHDFASGAVLEAAHQVERWGSEHDAGKTPADWFWLVGYLAGKALHAQTSGNVEKALHHTISTAGALANWHRAINGANDMRPGIIPPALARTPAHGDDA